MEPELGLVACLRKDEAACAIAPVCVLKGLLSNATQQFPTTLDEHNLAKIVANKPRLVR